MAAMFRNHFLVAWRNLRKNKGFSSINIIGLAVGMAVTLLIALWAINEYSYDRFLPNYEQLYQAEINFNGPNGIATVNSTSLPLAAALRTEIPGIKRVAETDNVGKEKHDLWVGNRRLYLDGGAVAPEFLQMFRYPFVEGDPLTALSEPYSIILDQSTARALFAGEDPIGQAVRIDSSHLVKVTGVIKDIPANSTLQFSYLLPFAFKENTVDWVRDDRTRWTNFSFNTYVELDPGVSYAQIAPKIKDLIVQNSEAARPAKPAVWLHPMAQWHLYTDFRNGRAEGGFIDYVRIFSLIGLLVLIIACINFMNLSTARSEKRGREVGVRKALGSRRKELVLQFLIESVVITAFAAGLALALVQLALPAFDNLAGVSIHIPWDSPIFYAAMAGFILLTGLIAGSRPAFYLSAFNPVKVLKGDLTRSRTPGRWFGRTFSTTGSTAGFARKALVIGQFCCSVALIISTIIIYRQVRYARDRPTGYNASRLISTDMSSVMNRNYEALRNELMRSGLVEDVATSSGAITGVSDHFTLTNWPGKNANDQSINIGTLSVSANYFKTTGMTIAEGRDFSPDYADDSAGVVLNEAAIRRMGLKDPVGRLVSWNGSMQPLRVLGVVKDAIMESPFAPVEPAMFLHYYWGSVMLYRLSPNVGTQEALQRLRPIFEKYNPAYPYSYSFVDQDYGQKFKVELLVGKLAGVFAALAILISCLGLFGLVAYVAEQRTREIGIRKVLGASVSQLWVLLSKDFLLLVAISCVIASPIAYYFLHSWLQQYNYRISIGADVFVLATVLAILITVVTVSVQAIKAALANPVRSIGTE